MWQFLLQSKSKCFFVLTKIVEKSIRYLKINKKIQIWWLFDMISDQVIKCLFENRIVERVHSFRKKLYYAIF